MALILLRDLPGVEPLEWAIEEQGWTDDIEDAVDDLAETLFGISEYDIDADLDDETYFPALKMLRDESDAYWAARGWDVTDGKGKQLAVMDSLLRPLTCVVEKIHPDAKYGDGDSAKAEAWGASLKDEADRFKPSR